MKKFLALLMAMMLVLGLAACGEAATDPTEEAEPSEVVEEPVDDTSTEEEVVELTLATYPVGKMTDETVINDLIADFNAVYPNIHITVQYLDYTNGDDTVNTAIEAGTAPDLIFEGPERLVANWGAKGYLVDLSELLTGSEYSATISSCTSSDGAVYELPICQTAHCMAINYDLFEAAGALQYIDEETHTWTTEGFANAVQALYDYGQTNVAAVFCGGQGGDQGTRALVTNLYGGTFTNAEHTEYTANCAENVQALELLNSLDGINFDASIVGGDEISLFCNGTLAMAFCWNVAQETSETAGQTAQFEIFPMAFPTNEGADPVLQGGIWGFGVFNNGDEAKIEAAKTFISFMITDDAQYSKIVEATSYWPVRDVEGMYEGNEVMTEYGMFVPYMGDYYQITLGWTEARTAWWNELQNIGSGAKDVQTALDDFVATANAAAAAAAGA